MGARRLDRIARTVATAASRRDLLRLLAGTAGTALLGAPLSAAAQSCRRDGARCDLDPECCSGRCRLRRCRPARLAAGSQCTRDEQCRSGVCGRINRESSICRREGCRRERRPCSGTVDCCSGVCDARTRECAD